ncbi:hypothetical protein [Methylomonas rhizoryzae]|nr:hypothetical protein [Methylomonas rhizoryzae]
MLITKFMKPIRTSARVRPMQRAPLRHRGKHVGSNQPYHVVMPS